MARSFLVFALSLAFVFPSVGYAGPPLTEASPWSNAYLLDTYPPPPPVDLSILWDVPAVAAQVEDSVAPDRVDAQAGDWVLVEGRVAFEENRAFFLGSPFTR